MFKMKHISSLIQKFLLLTLIMSNVLATNESYKLLFSGKMDIISEKEMKEIAATLGYSVSEDGKNLIENPMCGPIYYEVKFSDINQDKIPEVTVIGGNTCNSGNSGAYTHLFIKSEDDTYKQILALPAIGIKLLENHTNGFPDLTLVEPGFCHAVWSWDGEKYNYKCSLESKKDACKWRKVKLCSNSDI